MSMLVIPVLLCVVIVIWNKQSAWRNLSVSFTTKQTTVQDSLSSSSIGPMLEVTFLGENARCIQPSVALLNRLLKSVDIGDAVVLTLNQRGLLHICVTQGHWGWLPLQDGNGLQAERCDLRPAAVSALGVLGDPTSIPILERFARKSKDPDLCASALRSTGQIRERFSYGSEQMLRASVAPQCPDTLLRPAAADKSQDSEPHQLLRADLASEFRRNSVTSEEK
jgi:hypothetical protein